VFPYGNIVPQWNHLKTIPGILGWNGKELKLSICIFALFSYALIRIFIHILYRHIFYNT